MHKSKKRLVLASETIRSFHLTQLRRAVGGATIFTCTEICPDTSECATRNNTGCVDTRFIHGCNGPTLDCK